MPKIMLKESGPASLHTRGFLFTRGLSVTVPEGIFESLIDDGRFEKPVVHRKGEGSTEERVDPHSRDKPVVKMSDVFRTGPGQNPHRNAAGDEVPEADTRTDERLDDEEPSGVDPIYPQGKDETGVVTGHASLQEHEQRSGLAGTNPANMSEGRQEIVTDEDVERHVDTGAGQDTDQNRKEIVSQAEIDSGDKQSTQPPVDRTERIEGIKAGTGMLEEDEDFDEAGLPTPLALARVMGWLPVMEDIRAACPPPKPTTAEAARAQASGGKATPDKPGTKPADDPAKPATKAKPQLKIARKHEGTRSQNSAKALDTGEAAAKNNDKGTGGAVEV